MRQNLRRGAPTSGREMWESGKRERKADQAMQGTVVGGRSLLAGDCREMRDESRRMRVPEVGEEPVWRRPY